MRRPAMLIISAFLMVTAGGAGFILGTQTEGKALFTDVPDLAEFSPAIQNLTMRGIVRGYGNGQFGPNDAVTRGQMAEVLYRYDRQIVQPLLKEVALLRAFLKISAPQEETKETKETKESDAPPVSSLKSAPSATTAPSCGNGICEIKENDIPPDRRYHCPQDCTGAPVLLRCEEKKRDIQNLAERYESCQISSDCQKVTQTCPFITCGEAINKSGVPSMELLIKDTLDTCRREGSITQCVMCTPSSPYCDHGRCTLKRAGE